MNRYVDIHTHHPTGRHIEPQGIGTHPWDAAHKAECVENFNEAQLIGEIGLDYSTDIDRNIQEQVFRRQLFQAQARKLSVVLHCVKAFEPTIKILSDYKLKAVIFHGFIGSEQQAAEALRRGYYLSFGPNVLRSPKSIKALKTCPLEQIFIETDESDITIEEMYAEIARLRGVDVAILASKIIENYKQIFNI